MMPLSRRRLLAGLVGAPLISRAAERPHLVLCVSDDHGWWDSPTYGSRVVRTPGMDKLAAEGAVFRNAFTGAAICIPSRAILASGLCSHRNGAIANGKPMRPGVRTLPSYMNELGYRVAHFGKSHFLPRENYTGWEDVPSEIKGEGPLNSDLDTAAVDRWLADRDPGDKRPLCLVVCTHSPHVYWEANRGYDPARVELPPTFVDTPETRDYRCQYYTDITKMDRQLGEVYTSVRQRLGNNALFIYTSDNGPQWPFSKWNLYDAGIRMPMLASWPGVVRPGTRSDAFVHFTDFLPTFIELAGAKAPADLDGRSFAGVLQGRTGKHRGEIFAAHTADDNGHMNCYPMRTVRDSRYKYILNLHPEFAFRTHIDRAGNRDGKVYWNSWVAKAESDPKAKAIVRRYHKRPEEELYDIAADPHETTNLAGKREVRGVLAAMRAKVRAWMDGMGDKGEVFGVPRPLDKEGLPV